eukprot:m.429341 g.429341  ORF g.429341 m.429341 type:complete len:106 (+) comp16991_c0_seq1:3021-3338(+)
MKLDDLDLSSFFRSTVGALAAVSLPQRYWLDSHALCGVNLLVCTAFRGSRDIFVADLQCTSVTFVGWWTSAMVPCPDSVLGLLQLAARLERKVCIQPFLVNNQHR